MHRELEQSIVKIAFEMKINVKTVRKWLNRYLDEGSMNGKN